VEVKGLIVGGLIPAFAFGVAGLLQKSASRTSPGTGPYLICIGGGVLLTGAILTFARSDHAITWRAGLIAASLGAAWSLGMALVELAIARYGTPLAKLAPLYNMNTLVVVILALLFFAEARDVAVPKLITGAVMIVIGGMLVARA
jgi:hypothetical protein